MQTSAQQSLAQTPIPQADVERKAAMQSAWKAYRGQLPNPLKVTAGQPNDNVLSNRCEPIVNKGVSFLFGAVLKLEATDENTDGNGGTDTPPAPVAAAPNTPPARRKHRRTRSLKPSPKQDFLDGLWGDDDDRMTLLSQMGINGAVCGQQFVKLIPAQGAMQYPRLVVMDPMLVRMVSSPDDVSLVLAYIIEYPVGDDLQKRQIIARIDPDGLALLDGYDDIDETWTITNYARKGTAGSWFRVGAVEHWPYPFAPIFTNQNLPNPNELWGAADLSPDLIEMNRVLNFVQSNTSRIIKFHAHPKTWAKGVGLGQISVAVDETIVLESDTAAIGVLEMKSDLHSSLAFAGVIRSDMDEQSRVPAVALGRLEALPKGNISGVALQLLFQPLVEKTTQKQRLYGQMIRAVSRAAMVVASIIPVAEFERCKIDLHWQNLLPIDDLSAAQTAQILQSIGVSSATILAKLGYDAEDEAVKSANEAALKPPPPAPVPIAPLPQETQQPQGAAA